MEMENQGYYTGIYDMSSEQYHADPCPEPSLSASLAHTIINHTVLHAYLKHPKLQKVAIREEADHMDFGRAAHALLFEPHNANIEVIDADNWRTAEAREKKAKARAEGKSPLLTKDFVEARAMVDAANSYIERSSLKGVLSKGKAEQTFIAQDDKCWLRGRLDFITHDRALIIDYKTVSRTANADLFVRNSVFNYGYDIQAAMYCYLNQLLGYKGRTDYVWLLQETEYPYACSLVGANSSILDSGLKKIEIAKALWLKALKSNKFDGYPEQVIWMDAPPWELAKTENIELNHKEAI